MLRTFRRDSINDVDDVDMERSFRAMDPSSKSGFTIDSYICSKALLFVS